MLVDVTVLAESCIWSSNFFFIVTEVLLIMQALWDVMSCHWVSSSQH
jgi:hypothetical protein